MSYYLEGYKVMDLKTLLKGSFNMTVWFEMKQNINVIPICYYR